MSTEYISNIPYDTFLQNFKVEKDCKVHIPELRCKILFLNNNYIHVYKGELNMAIFERIGRNNPTKIFNLILKQFPDSEILEEYSLIKWPDCGGYGPD